MPLLAKPITSLHLFAGVGGGILADSILGFRVVGAVEINAYCRDVLKARQIDGSIEPFPIFNDVKTFQGLEIDRPTIICGGFPCQDISSAGTGAGIRGKKSSLFFELARIVRAVSPPLVFLENSPCITSRGLDSVLREFAALGYDAEWDVISAGACGAPHMRERWWCLCKRQDVDAGICEGLLQAAKRRVREVSDAKDEGRRPDFLSERLEEGKPMPSGRDRAERERGWWETEPAVGRVVNELPGQLDRVRALGNAQVPTAAALAFILLLRRYLD